jgi:hypothetical protein
LPPAGQSGYLGPESAGSAGREPAGRKSRDGLAETAELALTKAEMTKEGSTGGPADPRAARRQERAERLSAALKANLRRRKAQAREKGERERAAGQPGHDQGPDSVEAIMDKKAGDRELINRETINGDPMNRAPSGKAP